MKTDAQLQSLELGRLKRGNKCPACGASKVYVIESRPSSNGTRRRKKCSSCGWRTTTYEIDASRLQRLLDIEKVITTLQPLLDSLPPANESKCDDCKFNDSSACNHGLPEFQSEDSHDCIYYQASGFTSPV